MPSLRALSVLSLCLLFLAGPVPARGLRDAARLDTAPTAAERIVLPPGTRRLADVAYGSGSSQTLDLYLPKKKKGPPTPLLVFVHGGGWYTGDKAGAGLSAKLAHWLPQGVAVASINYPLVPQARPLAQARDVAAAVAFVQARASEWNLAPDRVVLMGHSAGAHLVGVVAADPSWLAKAGATPIRGAVLLDSAALDVPSLMAKRRLPDFYRDAFGEDPRYWRTASPMQRLHAGAPPMLLVCSSTRRYPAPPCPEAEAFARVAGRMAVDAAVQPQALDHMQINRTLGLDSEYTRQVSDWIAAHLR